MADLRLLDADRAMTVVGVYNAFKETPTYEAFAPEDTDYRSADDLGRAGFVCVLERGSWRLFLRRRGPLGDTKMVVAVASPPTLFVVKDQRCLRSLLHRLAKQYDDLPAGWPEFQRTCRQIAGFRG